MNDVEMIKKFVCPGCASGMDTTCGHYKPIEWGEAAGCRNHVVGTMSPQIGSFAIGLPTGFNRAGHMPLAKEWTDKHNQMWILCWPKDSGFLPEWDKFNVPVWAMEKDGFLFVRTYRPRINETCVDVIEEGSLDFVPQAINVGEFYDEIE